MKKEYLSPELEVIKVNFVNDVLADSRGENTGSGGSGSGGEFGPTSEPVIEF